MDFQFPWYAYIVDVAGDGVDIGTNDDDTVTYGGLLLEDPDGTWARDTTLGYYDNPDGDPVPGAVMATMPEVVVAGYYVATPTGDSGDEVRASYGPGVATLSWDNKDLLSVETIAHWPPELDYAGMSIGLYWSMYPGQEMLDPYNYPNTIPVDSSWETFRSAFDVDPSVALTERDTPANPAQEAWNRPAFNYSEALSSGRTVSFNYRSIGSWNPRPEPRRRA